MIPHETIAQALLQLYAVDLIDVRLMSEIGIPSRMTGFELVHRINTLQAQIWRLQGAADQLAKLLGDGIECALPSGEDT